MAHQLGQQQKKIKKEKLQGEKDYTPARAGSNKIGKSLLRKVALELSLYHISMLEERNRPVTVTFSVGHNKTTWFASLPTDLAYAS